MRPAETQENSKLLFFESGSAVIVSPHLDDAVFSLAGFIEAAPVPFHIVSYFTEGSAEGDAAWAKAGGFDDTISEYRARRQEDALAMQSLGLPFTHCGGIYGSRELSRIRALVHDIQFKESDSPTVVLLPLGAGGNTSGFSALVRRVTRTPFGAPPHPDHIWVRDQFAAHIAHCKIGYYAEIPYYFANSSPQLDRLAARLLGRVPKKEIFRPDAAFKRAAMACYDSQFELIFGGNEIYQGKICAAPEIVFY